MPELPGCALTLLIETLCLNPNCFFMSIIHGYVHIYIYYLVPHNWEDLSMQLWHIYEGSTPVLL